MIPVDWQGHLVAVTQDGLFHADDVLARAILSLLNSQIGILRSRDSERIATADIVFDVGGVYDPATRRFDHHQPGGAGYRENGMPYASAGLLWKAVGQYICGSESVAEEVDRILIQVVDAVDNGVSVSIPGIPGVLPVGLSNLVTWFNPTWREGRSYDFDFGFDLAFEFMYGLLTRAINVAAANVEARTMISQSMQLARDPRIIRLGIYMPWEEVIPAESAEVQFVVFPSSTRPEWVAQAVPTAPGLFDQRTPFPAEWAGLSGQALEDASGVKGAIFCHNAQFLCKADTEAAVTEMVHKALASRL